MAHLSEWVRSYSHVLLIAIADEDRRETAVQAIASALFHEDLPVQELRQVLTEAEAAGVSEKQVLLIRTMLSAELRRHEARQAISTAMQPTALGWLCRAILWDALERGVDANIPDEELAPVKAALIEAGNSGQKTRTAGVCHTSFGGSRAECVGCRSRCRIFPPAQRGR